MRWWWKALEANNPCQLCEREESAHRDTPKN